ncbi:hypothetical protein ElyMa_003928800 [Elysia marginata]|uniref:Uncharacterized protein n=1 Tax=Elysia marginata TaxID=1093978 RepID=A0AAV4FR19_9GAST|nr:hypothetical protein ElyMa_003928800 [Elysia marginata]
MDLNWRHLPPGSAAIRKPPKLHCNQSGSIHQKSKKYPSLALPRPARHYPNYCKDHCISGHKQQRLLNPSILVMPTPAILAGYHSD